MSFLLRIISAAKSATNVKSLAAKTAEGVRKTKQLTSDIKANHFSLSYERALEGNVGEQCEVAERYYEGRGIRQNFEDAALWFGRAAKAGNAKAQAAFAMMLFLGRGVETDPIEAAKWIELAALQEERSALDTRNKIFECLSHDQLVEAKNRLERFRPERWSANPEIAKPD